MVRTPSLDKNGLRKGTWTPDEDRRLIAYVTRYGCWNWRQLPRFAGLARCGKSCRLRWMNYLRPNIKRGNFTLQEEDIIIRLHTKLGNRWSTIAAELPGRTDNEIKNHWHTNLKKRYQHTDNNLHLQAEVTPPATYTSDTTAPLSPISSCSEFSSDHTAASNESTSLLLEDIDLPFLDASFWTETETETHPTESSNCNSFDANHILSSCALSPAQSLVLESEFGSFLDANAHTTMDHLWTHPYQYVPDMFHVPPESLDDADLWSQNTHLN